MYYLALCYRTAMRDPRISSSALKTVQVVLSVGNDMSPGVAVWCFQEGTLLRYQNFIL